MNLVENRVIVNGRPKYLTERVVTRDRVLQLAGHDPFELRTDNLKVEYRVHNDGQKTELGPLAAMPITNDMIVDVYFPPYDSSIERILSVRTVSDTRMKLPYQYDFATDMCTLKMSRVALQTLIQLIARNNISEITIDHEHPTW